MGNLEGANSIDKEFTEVLRYLPTFWFYMVCAPA